MNTDIFAGKYRIPSNRAAWWDYGANGAYFVTICTTDRQTYFGEIKDNQIELTEIGRIADQYWKDIPKHFPFVKLDEHIIMPNHLHGIIIIDKPTADISTVETQDFASLQSQNHAPQPPRSLNHFGPQSQNLGSIIRGFKSGVKKYATLNQMIFEWQSRFHDHVIRDDAKYRRIIEYIRTNTANWNEDRFYR